MAAVAGIVAVSPAANADPTRTYNAVGASATQDAFNAFTDGPAAAGTGLNVASWNATAPGTETIGGNIQTVFGGDTFERPSSSIDGLGALSAAWNPSNDEWDTATGGIGMLGQTAVARSSEISFARSTVYPDDATTVASGAQLTYLPEAGDAVGVAELTNSGGTAQAAFTTAQLQALYGGLNYHTPGPHVWNVGSIDSTDFSRSVYVMTATNPTPVVGTNAEYVYPVLQGPDSGNRLFFERAVGVSTLGSDVVVENLLAENDIQALTPPTILSQGGVSVNSNSIAIMPFSGASAIAQQKGLAGDTGVSLTGLSWPTLNSETLFTGSGATAAVGTLASSETASLPGAPVYGNFADYVWAVLPSSVAVQNTSPGTPGAEGTLQVWLDQTLAAAPNQSIWTEYGFLNLPAGFTDNDTHWAYSSFLN